MRKPNEIRSLDKEQLAGEANRLRKQLFELRNKHAMGQLETKHELREIRRELAQVLTIINEKGNQQN
jgi:large subunit ribosomal protein L29